MKRGHFENRLKAFFGKGRPGKQTAPNRVPTNQELDRLVGEFCEEIDSLFPRLENWQRLLIADRIRDTAHRLDGN